MGVGFCRLNTGVVVSVSIEACGAESVAQIYLGVNNCGDYKTDLRSDDEEVHFRTMISLQLI